MHDWILLQDGLAVYLGLFLLFIGGAIGLPIPEDIPLILAGILAHRGNGDPLLLFIVCYVAIILGDIFIYGVGRKFGPALYTKRWFRSRVSHSRIQSIKRNLEKRSLLMIFLARHLFYLRTVTFLISGAVRMSFKRFLIADLTAALVSAPLMMTLGYVGAEHYEALSSGVTTAKNWSLMLGLIAIVVITFLYLRKKAREEADGENAESSSE